MIRNFLFTLTASLVVVASASAAIPAEAVWPLPSPPPGTSPAAFAAPRLDWVERVQSSLERTRGKHFDIVFDGDSITDGWQGTGRAVWAEHYTMRNAVDFGISGDKVEHLRWRLKLGQVDGMDPKLVVMMIGTNNTGRDTAAQIADGIKVATADYLNRCPHAHLLLLAVFPRAEKATDPARAKIAAINKEIASLAGSRVTFLDLGSKFLAADGTLPREIMPDFLHPSAAGYKIWADAIQPIVEKYTTVTSSGTK